MSATMGNALSSLDTGKSQAAVKDYVFHTLSYQGDKPLCQSALKYLKGEQSLSEHLKVAERELDEVPFKTQYQEDILKVQGEQTIQVPPTKQPNNAMETTLSV